VEGQDFAINLLTPIHPSEVFALIEAGWNAERSLRLMLKTINGISAYDPVSRTPSAAYILAPEAHVADGRTRANRITAEEGSSRPLLRVYSSEKKPEDVLVSVRSRNHWFYIDDRDIDSKKAFSFLMIIMQLTAAQQEDRGPAVTIGAG